MRKILVMIAALLAITFCAGEGRSGQIATSDMTAFRAGMAERAEQWNNKLRDYRCLEVETFTVDYNDFSEEGARATYISDATLLRLQQKLVSELGRILEFLFVSPTTGSECTSRTLVLSGLVKDYNKGDWYGRVLLVGMGAGEDRHVIQCTIRDRATGAILADREIERHNFFLYDDTTAENQYVRKIVSFVKLGPTFDLQSTQAPMRWILP